MTAATLPTRRSAPRRSTRPGRDRAPRAAAEAVLRDVAYVLHLTRVLKESLEAGRGQAR
jgi:hypothetical protein